AGAGVWFSYRESMLYETAGVEELVLTLETMALLHD
ncbi:hypothetical protein Tco_0473708, partial [Tanacetum coccineum]